MIFPFWLPCAIIGAVALAGAGVSPGNVHDPAHAVANLDVHPELEATLFASEPMVLSLTNLDVDHRGRVWVCEVVNYRGHDGKRPEGDRILILEDEDGDGKADSVKVFYQGRDIDSAMGIAVLGSMVIVSASPHIFVFHDDDGDDKPDRKELLFTKTGQPQHDHSAHSFIFGPDGRFYWNFGNTGVSVHDRDGKPVIDRSGNRVADNGKPYFGGMVFRTQLDGSGFEVLAHNFRNNYETAVDSFGTLWQSDNDDDGNRGVRINYVMEFGNYGYRDEMTGAGWSTPRTGMHAEIPFRHWHQNDPGVVPNLLHTGAGSPAGITVYEGDLLPQVFRGQMIHCDPGPSVVRAYPVKKDGAGYQAEIVNILEGTRNKWFRPADVCTAPDGSLFVTDWYDPGVGGHAMGDLERGRIFRVAPPGHRYRVPRLELSTPAGAIEALKNPSYSVRYLAWTALHAMGEAAEPALLELFDAASAVPAHRARALWLLGRIEGRGVHHVERALADPDPDIRVVALRLGRQLGLDIVKLVRRVVRDSSAEVRREAAIALRHSFAPEAASLWAELAHAHDGKDRWYLEALGIGADRQWDGFFEAWLERAGESWRSAAGRDIVWRSRAGKSARHLAEILRDPSTPEGDLPRLLRAFDFLGGDGKREALLELAFASEAEGARADLIAFEALRRLKGAGLADPESGHAAALGRILDRLRGRQEFVELVGQLEVAARYPELLDLALKSAGDPLGAQAMRVLLAKNQLSLIRGALQAEDAELAGRALRALGAAGDGRAAPVLLPLLGDETRPAELRRSAVAALARSEAGARELIRRAKDGELDESLKFAASLHLLSAPWNEIRSAAAGLFPLAPLKGDKPLPPLVELLKIKGDAARGKLVYASEESGNCIRCHVVNGAGKEVGPDLSEIGSKLSREALYESILYPNAGISHNYETHALVLRSGEVQTGILLSETPEAITLRGADALAHTFARSDVLESRKEKTSLMPADLHKQMTASELADLIEYLASLRKAE
jgi:putative membrane-bound dehydrogenase-like protein